MPEIPLPQPPPASRNEAATPVNPIPPFDQPTESIPMAHVAEMTPVEKIQSLATQSAIVEVIKTIFDPEIPVNIYELGLIYGIDVDPTGNVLVKMTLTSPMCPVAGSLPPEVETKVKGVDGVTNAKVELVWEPPWSPDKMSQSAKLQLNIE